MDKVLEALLYGGKALVHPLFESGQAIGAFALKLVELGRQLDHGERLGLGPYRHCRFGQAIGYLVGDGRQLIFGQVHGWTSHNSILQSADLRRPVFAPQGRLFFDNAS